LAKGKSLFGASKYVRGQVFWGSIHEDIPSGTWCVDGGRSVIIKDIGGNSVILAKIRGSSVNCRNCKAKIFSLLSRVLTDRDAEILIEASAAYSMRGISVVPMNGYCNMS
jgi:hypothetical protein